MKKLVKLLIPLALIALFILALKLVSRPRTDETLLGSGLIEADEYEVSSKLPGKVAELLVQEGDEVKAGQVIARLEHQDIDAEIAQAEAAVAAAKAGLADLVRGTREEQLRAGKAQYAQAIASRKGAELQLATAIEAWNKVTDLRAQVDASKAKLTAAEANVRSAYAALDEAKRGPTAEEIETAKAAVRQAEAAVASAITNAGNARRIYDSAVKLETQTIAAATEEQLASAQAGLTERELARVTQMAESDAATPQALDQARTASESAAIRAEGAQQMSADAAEQVALNRAKARQGLDAAEDAVAQAKAARDTAQAQLNVLLAGTREERIRKAEALVAAAEAEQQASRSALARATEAYTDRLEARSKKDAAEAGLQAAREQEKFAKAQLDLLIAGATKEAIKLASAKVAQAESALKFLQVKRSYCDVVAPTAGVVTQKVALVGETVPAGAPVVVIADLTQMWLRAYLGFETLGQIKLGDRLPVTTEAARGREFTGEIISISDQAEFTPKDVQTAKQRTEQVYWVKVALGDGEGILKPGMPADLRQAIQTR